jgi:CRISPR type III-associated protein (TIGR04423 family)
MDNAYEPIIKLSDIDDTVHYTGYLWLDNKSAPEEIDGKISDKVDLMQMEHLPFIIEGHLIAKDNSHSISIRFVDSRYIIGKVVWSKVPNDMPCEDHVYLAHNFQNAKKICFKEAWLPFPDSLCEDRNVLKPAWIAFTGFDNSEGG